jgi:hypothetical protein
MDFEITIVYSDQNFVPDIVRYSASDIVRDFVPHHFGNSIVSFFEDIAADISISAVQVIVVVLLIVLYIVIDKIVVVLNFEGIVLLNFVETDTVD